MLLVVINIKDHKQLSKELCMSDGVASAVISSSITYNFQSNNRQGTNLNPIDAALANKAIREVTDNWNDNYRSFLTVLA